MATWEILVKELRYQGVRLVDSKKCFIDVEGGSPSAVSTLQAIRQINKAISFNKRSLLSCWRELQELLGTNQVSSQIIDDKLVKLFVFSLKDLLNYLLCFEECDDSQLYASISNALNRDIKSFSKEQISAVPEYKMAIDWFHRTITRLYYIRKLLATAMRGQRYVAKYDVKTARGVSGPWSRTDLPMEERMMPFDSDDIYDRITDKQNQRRYWLGLQNYANDRFVGEGRYWIENNIAPYSWYDREEESPYPMGYKLRRAASKNET